MNSTFKTFWGLVGWFWSLGFFGWMIFLCMCARVSLKRKQTKRQNLGHSPSKLGEYPWFGKYVYLLEIQMFFIKKKSLEACDFTLNKQIKTM